jgi:hypothetical protein
VQNPRLDEGFQLGTEFPVDPQDHDPRVVREELAVRAVEDELVKRDGEWPILRRVWIE